MIQYELKLLDGRLIIDLNHMYEDFRVKGFTGLPERFDAADLALAPIVGTVSLSIDQVAEIEATYTNGGKCAWCGEIRTELRHSHMFDRDPNGGKMCRHCWDHDRDMYKGSYGEDIGPFSPEDGRDTE